MRTRITHRTRKQRLALKRPQRSKYREVAVLDCHTGPDCLTATEVVRVLRRHNITARRGHSPYVGKVAVVVDFDRLTDLRNILRMLSYEFGISGVGDRYRMILSGLRNRAAYAGYVR